MADENNGDENRFSPKKIHVISAMRDPFRVVEIENLFIDSEPVQGKYP